MFYQKFIVFVEFVLSIMIINIMNKIGDKDETIEK